MHSREIIMVNKKGAIVLFPQNNARTNFHRLSVLLSSLGERRLQRHEMSELTQTISSRIDNLEADLDNGAEGLRRAIKSFLMAFSDKRKDEFPITSVSYRSRSRESISIEATDRPGECSDKKIEQIIEGSIRAAEADLASLRKALDRLEKSAEMDDHELSKLRQIIENNSYWRFIDVL